MTVKDLIRELKKHPPDARVGWQDHDAADNEVSSFPSSVSSFDPETSVDPRYYRTVRMVIRGG